MTRITEAKPYLINTQKLTSTMLELAARGPHEESLMLQVANAGDLLDVSKEIKKRRASRAKFTKRGNADAPAAQGGAKKKATRKRKGNSATTPAVDPALTQAGVQSELHPER